MTNFTSDQHQRNADGNVVIEPASKTIAKIKEKQSNRNFVNGVIISALALTVVLTGTLLGATAKHNRDLRAQIQSLQQSSAQQSSSYMGNMGASTYGSNFGMDGYNSYYHNNNGGNQNQTGISGNTGITGASGTTNSGTGMGTRSTRTYSHRNFDNRTGTSAVSSAVNLPSLPTM